MHLNGLVLYLAQTKSCVLTLRSKFTGRAPIPPWPSFVIAQHFGHNNSSSSARERDKESSGKLLLVSESLYMPTYSSICPTTSPSLTFHKQGNGYTSDSLAAIVMADMPASVLATTIHMQLTFTFIIWRQVVKPRSRVRLWSMPRGNTPTGSNGRLSTTSYRHRLENEWRPSNIRGSSKWFRHTAHDSRSSTWYRTCSRCRNAPSFESVCSWRPQSCHSAAITLMGQRSRPITSFWGRAETLCHAISIPLTSIDPKRQWGPQPRSLTGTRILCRSSVQP